MARILLIEDDEPVREAVRLTLTAMGHCVHDASNGKAGLILFEQEPPELVVTDLVMPEMEGMETIRALKRADPSVKIIAMSGGGINGAEAYLSLAKKLGAEVILAKPFSRGMLVAAINEALPRAPAAKPFTFLVLDDDPGSRFLSRRLLEREFPRCTVVECESVESALDASARQMPDAVITDHHLGQTAGGEFVQFLRARGAACPILMVTASNDPAVHGRAYAAGASRVFSGGSHHFTG